MLHLAFALGLLGAHLAAMEEVAGFSRVHLGSFFFERQGARELVLWRRGKDGKQNEVWRETLRCRTYECPHTVAWIDFDDNGDKELFLLSSQSDRCLTEVWRQQWRKEALSFSVVFQEKRPQCGTVVTLQGNRVGILMDGAKAHQEIRPQECASEAVLGKAMGQLRERFLRLAGSWGLIGPAAEGALAEAKRLRLFSSFEIWSFQKGRFRREPAPEAEHRHWKRQLIPTLACPPLNASL